MHDHDRNALAALATAGALWGLTVPLSKLALGWLAPAWLSFARFAVAAPLLALCGRRGLRRALTPRIAASGAVGFGAVIVLQNAGIARTSVTHAALLVGAVPVLVAVIAAASGQGTGRARNWTGYLLTLGGIALIARSGGSGARPSGDLLVLASVVLSATFIVLQPRLLAGRDAAAVTAVQFAAGALLALPLALLTEPAPALPHAAPLLALAALSVVGTLLPFWLFAFGQARVPADVAGTFVNLEPVVGAITGWVAFGDAATFAQLAGALTVLAGIALSTTSARTLAGAAHGRTPRTSPWRSMRPLMPVRGRDILTRAAPIGAQLESHVGTQTGTPPGAPGATGDDAVRRFARGRARNGKPRGGRGWAELARGAVHDGRADARRRVDVAGRQPRRTLRLPEPAERGRDGDDLVVYEPAARGPGRPRHRPLTAAARRTKRDNRRNRGPGRDG
jgi:drug/metabolite transporter (DMT)-like permease